MLALGAAMLVRTELAGPEGVVVGHVVGLTFVVLGGARVWLMRRMGGRNG
jgi:hypothetical protein